MQTYICEHCDSLECDTSVCPVCGGKTTLVKSEIFYCDECHCPTYFNTCERCHSKCRKIGTDIRPVFAKERLLLETLLGEPFKFAKSSIWCLNGRRIIQRPRLATLRYLQHIFSIIMKERGEQQLVQQMLVFIALLKMAL